MRRTLIVGVALVCVALFLTQASAQRAITPGGGGVPLASPAAIQVAIGTVPAGNPPPIVTVRGTVNVGNFPLDDQGNLKVSGGGGAQAAPVAHFVGVTTVTVDRQQGFDPEYPILAMNRACQAEFPETRSCLYSDILKAIPTPAWDGCVLLAIGFEGPDPVGLCIDSLGNTDFSGDPQHAACCGF